MNLKEIFVKLLRRPGAAAGLLILGLLYAGR